MKGWRDDLFPGRGISGFGHSLGITLMKTGRERWFDPFITERANPIGVNFASRSSDEAQRIQSESKRLKGGDIAQVA